MIRFSKIQIRLHWLTLMLIAITYAAMELRGWFLNRHGFNRHLGVI